MNALSKVLLPVLALTVGLAAPLSLSAQPSGDRPQRPERAGPGGPGGGGPGARLEQMSERLALTAEQKTKVQAILESERSSVEALRADASLTQEARREKMQAIRRSFAEQIRAILTPEQQAKFAETRGPGGPGGGQKGRPDGEPKK